MAHCGVARGRAVAAAVVIGRGVEHAELTPPAAPPQSSFARRACEADASAAASSASSRAVVAAAARARAALAHAAGAGVPFCEAERVGAASWRVALVAEAWACSLARTSQKLSRVEAAGLVAPAAQDDASFGLGDDSTTFSWSFDIISDRRRGFGFSGLVGDKSAGLEAFDDSDASAGVSVGAGVVFSC